ncbi:MAG: hypothetical protein PHN74_02825 [Candidatus Pacebacteria bacterium]|nr:hypothetical protein [Candidatus Paceibacterota bacterium]
MKKISKILLIIVILFVTLGMLLPIFNLHAQESLLKEVVGSVDDLINIKDNSSLSDEERLSQEIEARKSALLKIVDLSLNEIENLGDKLKSLSLTGEKATALKDQFLAILGQNEQYSGQLKESLSSDKAFSLDEIKQVAKDFKDWRETYYNENVRKILSFVIVFQEKSILKTADARLEKIISDLRKLESAKLIKREDSWNYLNSAIKNLANANLLNNKAEILLMSTLEDMINASTSTEVFLNDPLNNKKATSTEIKTENKNYDSIKSMVEKSMNEIKNAYKNFVDISNKIRKKLGY